MQFVRRSTIALFIILALTVTYCSPAVPQPSSSRGLTILLSNDDGYGAPGLEALIAALSPAGDVYVAAPAHNQSGKGHSVTNNQFLYVDAKPQSDGRTFYAIDATPATCVRLGLDELMPRKPDVVISGINYGENLGLTVYYSGTLGAAREAAMSGIPSIAVSMRGNDPSDYKAAAEYTRVLLDKLHQKNLLKPGLFLNLNFPSGRAKGIRIVQLSQVKDREVYKRHTDAEGHLYFEQSWESTEETDERTDVWAFEHGFITLTPMTLDTTDVKSLNSLRWLEKDPTQAASQ